MIFADKHPKSTLLLLCLFMFKGLFSTCLNRFFCVKKKLYELSTLIWARVSTWVQRYTVPRPKQSVAPRKWMKATWLSWKLPTMLQRGHKCCLHQMRVIYEPRAQSSEQPKPEGKWVYQLQLLFFGMGMVKLSHLKESIIISSIEMSSLIVYCFTCLYFM